MFHKIQQRLIGTRTNVAGDNMLTGSHVYHPAIIPVSYFLPFPILYFTLDVIILRVQGLLLLHRLLLLLFLPSQSPHWRDRWELSFFWGSHSPHQEITLVIQRLYCPDQRVSVRVTSWFIGQSSPMWWARTFRKSMFESSRVEHHVT